MRRACRGDADTSARNLFYTHSPHGMQVPGLDILYLLIPNILPLLLTFLLFCLEHL